ncbi:MAG: histidine phosphatase family protein [Alphaproteobacteria bacterium]|nr:histidine phosphatase family protein [Alphaproteobacteria bacterium]
MKKIALLRHFKSSWDNDKDDDFDRPLAPRGARSGALIAAWMAKAGLAPDLVLCSSARRTKESLALILPVLEAPVIQLERGLYLASTGDYFERLRKIEDRFNAVLMIGHNPGLGELARVFAGGKDPDIDQAFPTGAIAVFESEVRRWRDLARASQKLVAAARPRRLE